MVAKEKIEEKGGRFGYVAHLSVRVGRGFVTVVVRRHGAWLSARVNVIGSCPEPPRFGPRAPCWEVLKAFLSAPGIVEVTGATYLIRRILAESGYWFDKASRVYRRSPVDAKVVTAVTPQPARR